MNSSIFLFFSLSSLLVNASRLYPDLHFSVDDASSTNNNQNNNTSDVFSDAHSSSRSMYLGLVPLPCVRLIWAENAKATQMNGVVPRLSYAFLVTEALECDIEKRLEADRFKQQFAFEGDIVEAVDLTKFDSDTTILWPKAFKYACRKWNLFGPKNRLKSMYSMSYFGLIAFLKATNDHEFLLPTFKYPNTPQSLAHFVSEVFSMILSRPLRIPADKVLPLLTWFFGRVRSTLPERELKRLSLLFQAEKEYHFKTAHTKKKLMGFVNLVEYSLICAKEIAQGKFQFITMLEKELAQIFNAKGNSWPRTFAEICVEKDIFGPNIDGMSISKLSVIGLARIFHPFGYDASDVQGLKECLSSNSEDNNKYQKLVSALVSWILRREVSISQSELYPFLSYLFMTFHYGEHIAQRAAQLHVPCDFEVRYMDDAITNSLANQVPVQTTTITTEQIPSAQIIQDSSVIQPLTPPIPIPTSQTVASNDIRVPPVEVDSQVSPTTVAVAQPIFTGPAVQLLQEAVNIASQVGRVELYEFGEHYLEHLVREGIIVGGAISTSFPSLKAAIKAFFEREFPTGDWSLFDTVDMDYFKLMDIVQQAEEVVLRLPVPKAISLKHFFHSMLHLLITSKQRRTLNNNNNRRDNEDVEDERLSKRQRTQDRPSTGMKKPRFDNNLHPIAPKLTIRLKSNSSNSNAPQLKSPKKND